MPIKITRMNRTWLAFSILAPVRKDFLAEVQQSFGDRVNQVILSGTSPVAGFGRFDDYSDSYKAEINSATGTAKLQSSTKKQGVSMNMRISATQNKMVNNGKRLRPVNLKVTGDLLASQVLSVGPNGVSMSYTDQKFIYHNETGAGKSHVLRRMLPTRKGEKFSSVLTKWLTDAASAMLKRHIT